MSIKAIFVAIALAAAGLTAVSARAGTELATPPPSPDKPRRIMLQLSSDDPKAINGVLTNAVNTQKFYGQDNVEIVIVVFGAGMEALYSKTSAVSERVASLMQYDVKFTGCGNTMEATHHTADELIKGVEIVPSGVAEIVERQSRGWVYVRP